MIAKQLKRRRKTIIIVVLFVLVFLAMNAEFSPAFFFTWNHLVPLENISCNYLESEDVLPSANTLKFTSKSIFFHETSCKGGLNARQACAVESAARFHPDWRINVLFTAPATEKSLKNSRALLKTFDNIDFFRIHAVSYAKDTPLEKFINRGTLNRSRWPISHASDVMRYLSLYKWGGVYLDLDVVVAKPLGSLARNWAARESGTSVSAGAMAFSKDAVGRRVAEAAVREIERNFRGDSWGHNGPGVITRVLRKMCSSTDISKMTAATCNGFKVYGPEYFYPVKWSQAQVYFDTGHIDTNKAYVYHVWNHKTQHLKMQRGSPYETLAKKYCPAVYNAHLDKFSLTETL